MVKSIIVDDELKSRESLQILLTDFCENVEVAALCQNVAEGIKAIKEHDPDVVFLDIQMQRETGFDLLEKIDEITFDVIFTTAYSEYAIKAFQFSAIDYLLKPIDISDLNRAVKKIEKKDKNDISKKLNNLLDNLNPQQNAIKKLALPTHDGLVFVKIKNIIYLEATSNYTIFHTNDGQQYMVSRTLKEYDEMLSEYNFFRIHNAHLININYIKKYVRGDGGYVVLTNDVSLDVSKRKKTGFLQKLGH
ncbi:LytR/AlgR family response regulator transcription factor [Fulvivirga lutimaris]|uniref:LytR/AlgR family response regulator transcription factor n=1 Tax=Fulvivirga lutimaris TaxID=1819566 RepID=UPI0012BB7276|nr:LytTR family DNA-binding domain-containing protein [Fulvivirga lutimaris]MTI39893.1 response regulator transcription factor [Fulvivirga lutimaris]